MKLISIGSSKNCKVFIPSEYVSSYHAELLLLDNGEIFLTDCGSKNGTFVQGRKIEANVEVPVRRGDRIEFDDVPLNWSVVPTIPLPDPSLVKGVYGVGKSNRNKYRLNGDTVSRYHATIKEMKNGKWYIQDHSKNGTFINGQRIAPDQDVRIKASDTIICGSVGCPNPVPSNGFLKIFLPISGGVVALAALVLLIIKFIVAAPSLVTLENATVWVFGEYSYDVVIEDDPWGGVFEGWPTVWHFGKNVNQEIQCSEINALTDDNTRIYPISYQGTAFVISEYGELGTNRHVAIPWEEGILEDEDQIRQIMQKYIYNDFEELLDEWMEDKLSKARTRSESLKIKEDAIAWYQRMLKSPLKISGHLSYLGIGCSGTQIISTDGRIDKSNLFPCQVIATSSDTKQDVALLRLNSQETPSKIMKKGFYDLDKVNGDYSKLHSQDEVITIGYPGGISLAATNFRDKSTELKPMTRRSFISKAPNADIFEIQMNVISGASGSPVLNKKRQLIGVAFGAYTGGEIGYVCNIKYLKDLFDKYKVK